MTATSGKKLNEDWYGFLTENKQKLLFSEPHILSCSGNDALVCSCLMEIKNINNPENAIGVLILNVDCQYLKRVAKSTDAGHDGYLWLNNGVVFYTNGNETLMNSYRDLPKTAEDQDSFTFENSKGYFIVDHSAGDGWEIVSFTSRYQMYNRMKVFFIISFFFILISFASIILVMTRMSSRISDPIKKLTQTMSQVSKG